MQVVQAQQLAPAKGAFTILVYFSGWDVFYSQTQTTLLRLMPNCIALACI